MKGVLSSAVCAVLGLGSALSLSNGSTFLRLDPEQTAAWHSGAWVRKDSSGQGYSEMMWYAGGQYIYMRFPEGWPQIWQIVEILPDELRLRHAKTDYIFKRWRDANI